MVLTTLLVAGLATNVLATHAHHRRQDGDLQAYIDKMCRPAYSSFVPPEDTIAKDEALDALRRDSVFPCEHVFWVEQECRETHGNYGAESIQNDIKCVCGSKKFELDAACVSCYEAHGAPAEWVDDQREFYAAAESSVCSATTTHTDQFYKLTQSVKDAMSWQTGVTGRVQESDMHTSATQVDDYYTGAVQGSGAAPATPTESSLYNYDTSSGDELEYIVSVCMPNYHNFTQTLNGTRATDAQLAALDLTMASSPFPCEAMEPLLTNCTFPAGRGPKAITPEEIATEQQCVCAAKALDLQAACLNCYAVHGYNPAFVSSSSAVVAILQTRVCAATAAVPTTDFYGVAASVREEVGPMKTDAQTGSDRFPSQTQISNYYTATGAAQVTGAPAGVEGSGAEAGVTSTTAAAGAGELKAAGGVVMAIFGVMMAL